MCALQESLCPAFFLFSRGTVFPTTGLTIITTICDFVLLQFADIPQSAQVRNKLSYDTAGEGFPKNRDESSSGIIA